MPTLPSLTINDQKAWDRALAAFGTAAEYKAWLRQAVRAEVLRREVTTMHQDADRQISARTAELATFLNDAS